MASGEGEGLVTASMIRVRGDAPRAAIMAGALAVALAVLAGCAPAAGVEAELAAVYDRADGSTDANRADLRERDAALWHWAIDEGRAKTPAVGWTAAQWERASTRSYGAQELSLWDFHRDHMDDIEEALRSDIRSALDPDEVRSFYDAHPEAFTRHDTIMITVAEWADQRAAEPVDIVIDAASVRTQSEADEALVRAAQSLAVGETVTVDRGEGRFAVVVCTGRERGGVEPFEDVAQAAASALATSLLEQQLTERAGASEVSEN